MTDTKIEWADKVWNPVIGCTAVSPGCANCYAVSMAHRHASNPKLGDTYHGLTVKHPNGIVGWSGQVKCLPERLDQPLRWKQPSRIFVNSMSDLFHPDVPFEFVKQVWEIMRMCEDHTFLILTKRPERMVQFSDYALAHGFGFIDELNVWLGTSVENQATADERIPLLLQTPAAVHWISAEPLLGPVKLDDDICLGCGGSYSDNPFAKKRCNDCPCGSGKTFRYPHESGETWPIDWVVCGGESGRKARPMHPDWARGLRDQCKAADVPFFFKQWGEFSPCSVRVGKSAAGCLIDGVEHKEFPQ